MNYDKILIYFINKNIIDIKSYDIILKINKLVKLT